MTKKHFEHLAKLVRHWTEQIEAGIPVSPVMIADNLAQFCQSHNPGFDRNRFLQACRPNNLVNKL